jgi:AbrB family looped-hinge helix DNA binding protein
MKRMQIIRGSEKSQERAMTIVTKVGKRGAVVIPAAVRAHYRLNEGIPLIVEERPEGVLLRRASLSPTAEERDRFFDQLDEQIAATQRDDPASWEAELEERRIFEGTLMDGLEDEGVMVEQCPT